MSRSLANACLANAWRALLVAGAWLLGTGAGVAAPMLATDHLGNVLAPGEPLRVTLSGLPAAAGWRLVDWQGGERASGRLEPAQGAAGLALPSPGPGYFELVVEPDGCGLPCAARAALAVIPPPAGRADAFGVMTHVAHGWDQGFVPLLTRAGIANVRDEHYWARLEQRPGSIAFPAAWTGYMRALSKAGVRPLLEMTFANPLYDHGTTPTSPAALAAFGAYGRSLAQHYPGEVGALEVWNEINGNWCDGGCPADRVKAYAGLLRAARDAIKGQKAGQGKLPVEIVGGATAGIPLPWWRRLGETGAFAHLDVASVHSYREQPEGVETEIAALRAILRAKGAEKPIWVTETGSGGPSTAQRRDAALWLVKEMTLLRSAGVARIYWYLMRDYDGFDGLGLVRAPDSPYGRYAPNPAYVAYATLIRTLGDARPWHREPTDRRTRLYAFKREGGDEVRVGWSSAGVAELTLSAEQPLTLVEPMGTSRALVPGEDGTVRLRLDQTPVLILGQIEKVRERRPDRLLADAGLDFAVSPTARGSWRYGYILPGKGGDGAGQAYAAASDFHPLTPRADDWRDYWGDPHLPFLAVDREEMHPGSADGRPVWAVRRWQAPETATVRISGELGLVAGAGGAGAEGDGTEALIALDGRPVARWPLRPGERRSYTLELPVRAGEAVDLVVTPGPAADITGDATRFTAAVTAPAKAQGGRS